MKILIYTQKSTYLNFSVGGAETSLRTLAEALASNGHEVHYLTDMEWGRLYRYRTEVINGVQVHFAGYPDLPNKGIPLLQRWRAKLIKYYFNKTAEKIIRENGIELVHTYHEVPFMERFLWIRENKKLNYITLLRNGGKFWVEKLKSDSTLHGRYQSVFNRVDCINFNTGGMKTLFEEACDEMRMDVEVQDSFIHDIGLQVSHLENRWRGPGSKPYRILMASRFSLHQKRQELLVEAMAQLPEDLDVELTLVGDGENRKSVVKRVRELGLTQSVKVEPYMEQEQLWERMSESDLYVHACDFEGLSKIIIESMAMGLPVVASDVTPLNDYIEHGKSGLLTENTPKRWAELIEYALAHPELLRNISAEGTKRVKSRYNAEENVKEYERQFQRLIDATDTR